MIYSAQEIETSLEDVAKRIRLECRDLDVVLVVATGGFIFAADLVRALYRWGLDVDVKFINVSSYGDEKSPKHEPVISGASPEDVAAQRVLVVDDILDTGATMAAVTEWCWQNGANDVKTAVAFDKLRGDFIVDFSMMYCPDVFVAGYGLDDKGKARGAPHLYEVKND